jgi:protein-ribulosamine 3-kinase
VQPLAAVAAGIARLSRLKCAASPERRVAGGSINDCYRWLAGRTPLFVKVAARAAAPGFEAEAAGLAELGRTCALRVPKVLACGETAELAFLALEWLERGAADERCEARMGEGLAAQHATSAAAFGWRRDNTIGSTPQANGYLDSWIEFYRERRLRPQLALAVANGFGSLLGRSGERLIEALPQILGGHRPEPALLHGDLWGGNWFAMKDGEPAVFDPAVYYGDREADLAMTRLFGGFGPAFYRAYEQAAPLPPGAEVRCELYNLYHLLNHANLFGGGYALEARDLIERLLAEVRT